MTAGSTVMRVNSMSEVSAPTPRTGMIAARFSTGTRGTPHTFSDEGKPARVPAKENTMSTTTTDPMHVGHSILTIDQAAAYLSIPKATLYTWRTRRAGFGPRAVKFGGCLRYRRSDLEAWVAEHLEAVDSPSDGRS